MRYAVQKLEDCQRRVDSAEAERDRLIAVQSKIDTDTSSIEADFAGALRKRLISVFGFFFFLPDGARSLSVC